jgi:hypothetical protein
MDEYEKLFEYWKQIIDNQDFLSNFVHLKHLQHRLQEILLANWFDPKEIQIFRFQFSPGNLFILTLKASQSI